MAGKPKNILTNPALDYPDEWVNLVTKQRLKLGITTHLNGYPLIRAGLLMTIKDPEVVCQVTKLLYPDLAKLFKTTSAKVERAIRNAIEVSWDRGDCDYMEEIFGYSSANGLDRPTNSEFFANVADDLNLKHHLRDQLIEPKEMA